jgi:hypothetical protein
MPEMDALIDKCARVVVSEMQGARWDVKKVPRLTRDGASIHEDKARTVQLVRRIVVSSCMCTLTRYDGEVGHGAGDDEGAQRERRNEEQLVSVGGDGRRGVGE